MASTFTFYDSFKAAISGNVAMSSASINVKLITSSYSPATSDTWSTMSGDEVANANGYTTGGVALTSQTWTQTSGTATFTAANVGWTASGGSIVARYAVLVDSSNNLIAYILMDNTPADVTTTDGNTLTLQWNGSGIFTLT